MAAAPLQAFVERIAARPEVAGLVLGGSHAAGKQTAWSDLDLLMVLEGLDLPFTLVTTIIDGTLTELICCTRDDLRRAEQGDAPVHWTADAFVRLLGGRILVDRNGIMAKAAAWAATQPAPGPDVDPYACWVHAQYNVRQTRRYLASGDEAARTAVVARMLYSLHDVLRDYFTMRDMPWLGDKEALRYWLEHEPELRDAWLAAVAEPDIDRKVAAWEGLFPIVYARFGGLADPNVDLIQPAENVTIEQTYAAWKTLMD